ncbi:BA14K family protein [Mesorhizobium xinjiangense]|uniref:BA14K family protein n=1 Tax=Mesorhizobium xinjiangense TaxID=2678685 RepID=UPI0012ED50E9|nr:BA14K family protein [Mesorhizobium xinjiangense]
MRKLLSGLCASVLAFSVGATTLVPVQAAPLYPGKPAAVEGQVTKVQHRRHGRGQYRRHGPRRHYYRHRGHRGDRYVVRRGNRYYYRGHRGYRHYRPGYRRYNDWWFPAGAFVAGAIIGGALAQPPRTDYRVRRLSQSHVNWCYNRYRSYRASDNTFQPYNGPRRACVSPYY